MEVQLGAALESSTHGGAVAAGPGISFEFTPVEHWLQIELGVAALRHADATEWEGGVLFKLPIDLSPTAELTVGLGPTRTRTVSPTEHTDAKGAEFSLDFQFRVARRIGWYVEPSYSISHHAGTERSIGIEFGVLWGGD